MERADLFAGPVPRRDKFVQTVDIPPFNAPPDVLIWGDRVFLRYAGMSDSNPQHSAYCEVFAYAVPVIN